MYSTVASLRTSLPYAVPEHAPPAWPMSWLAAWRLRAHGPRAAPSSIRDLSIQARPRPHQTGQAATRVSPARWQQQQGIYSPGPPTAGPRSAHPHAPAAPEATGIARNLLYSTSIRPGPPPGTHLSAGPRLRTTDPGPGPGRPPISNLHVHVIPHSEGALCEDVSWMARAALCNALSLQLGRLDWCGARNCYQLQPLLYICRASKARNRAVQAKHSPHTRTSASAASYSCSLLARHHLSSVINVGARPAWR